MAERIIVRTVYGAMVQTIKQLGLTYSPATYTTLNEALVDSTVIPYLPSDKRLGMEVFNDYDYETDNNSIFVKWLVMGNGGHLNVTGATNGIPYTVPTPHKSTDSGLFSIMPFLMREISSDLTASERANYGLRRTLVINGVTYAAYFAKRLVFTASVPEMNVTTVTNGAEQTVAFVPTKQNLTPTQYTDTTAYTGQYASVSAYSINTFSASEIQDIRDAARLIFGNEMMAIGSELAICSAVEKVVTGKYPANPSSAMTISSIVTGNLTELAICQVNAFISTYVPFAYLNTEYSLTFNLGATEPLFGEASV